MNVNKLFKEEALHPEPKSKNLNSLKSIKIESLTYFQEGYGRTVEHFWKSVQFSHQHNQLFDFRYRPSQSFLFAGSHEAAQRSAMLYSLLGTCKLHGIEPSQWLKTVLEKIADHPINKIKELLPHHFSK